MLRLCSGLYRLPCAAASIAATVVLLGGTALAHPRVAVAPWGKLPSGQKVNAVTLTNDFGMSVRVLTYGAILQSVTTPDRRGKVQNIVLGFPKLEDYVRYNADPHFGAVLGRVANRIAHGTFMLGGKTYHTPINEGNNTLHGGPDSFDRKLWKIVDKGSTTSGAYLTLRMVSPDGDQGFPGALTTTVTYTLDQDNSLKLRFQARTNAPTVVNLSTHTYWNLNGEGSGTVEPEKLQILADGYIPTDSHSIPVGRIAPVVGTPFDFRTPKTVGAQLRSATPQMLAPRGYDKCWVINGNYNAAPRLAVRLMDPRSGRMMEILTNQPGVQFYTSNSLDGRYTGPSGQTYRQGDALAFEPQHFPDSPNQPLFPSTELKPGQRYDYTTIFRFSIVPR